LLACARSQSSCQVHVFNLTSINESAPWRSRSQFPARVIHPYPQEHLTSVQLFSICFLFRHGTFRAHECFNYKAGAAITLRKHDNGEKAAMPTKPVIAAMNAARQSRVETLPWLGKAPERDPARPPARGGVNGFPVEPVLTRAHAACGSPPGGRGALSNASGRFEKETRFQEDDGWDLPEDLPPLRTHVARESAKTIIARNDSPDISFDQSINPYRGCEHGCVYCFARPTHAFLGLSPGADFESRLFAKPNAAELLAKELSAPGYVPKVIAMGTNTDPY